MKEGIERLKYKINVEIKYKRSFDRISLNLMMTLEGVIREMNEVVAA